jgi:hypothetical protein
MGVTLNENGKGQGMQGVVPHPWDYPRQVGLGVNTKRMKTRVGRGGWLQRYIDCSKLLRFLQEWNVSKGKPLISETATWLKDGNRMLFCKAVQKAGSKEGHERSLLELNAIDSI